MQLSDPTGEIAEFDRHLGATFDRLQPDLRFQCRSIADADTRLEVQQTAWEALREVFAAWYYVERAIGPGMSPVELVTIRDRIRDQARFALFRHANFPDASRLLDKAFADPSRLERADERNPGAPPALDALYRRQPRARGDFPDLDRTYIEVLDHASMRLRDIDAVHDRTHAAVRILVPRIFAKLSAGHSYLLLDVACGGNQLGRHLSEALRSIGCMTEKELARIAILGVDVDPRAVPFTYRSSGLGWHEAGNDLALEVVLGNLFDPKTQNAVAGWLRRRDAIGFDAVTALGIVDYIGCAVPGEDRVYIPEASATVFGHGLRSRLASRGVLIAAVFSEEGLDEISTGARHLFANWHIEHSTARRMRERFPFLREADFKSLTGGADPVADEILHFIVHEVP